MSREDWGQAKVVAELWRCGDDVCDCSQPKVYRQGPNRRAGYPWVTRELLWAGTFRTDGEGPTPDDLEELRSAGLRLGAEYLEELTA